MKLMVIALFVLLSYDASPNQTPRLAEALHEFMKESLQERFVFGAKRTRSAVGFPQGPVGIVEELQTFFEYEDANAILHSHWDPFMPDSFNSELVVSFPEGASHLIKWSGAPVVRDSIAGMSLSLSYEKSKTQYRESCFCFHQAAQSQVECSNRVEVDFNGRFFSETIIEVSREELIKLLCSGVRQVWNQENVD